MLSFEQFLNKVDQAYNDRPFELRYGQTVMSILFEVWHKKYIQITTIDTEYDCFYDDGMVRLTLDFLEKEWNNERPI